MSGAVKTPLVIAATASGSGKTTVATGIMGALRRKGLEVAPFKAGPDYIDPGFHRAACGTESRNLDTWLTPAATARQIFQRASAHADLAVVEGVMGLFDGRAGVPGGDNAGSTAEVARLINGSVVLVVDCARMARSLAPLLSGFAAFDSRIRIGGAILNNAGSANHARTLESAAAEAGVPVMGVLPRSDDIGLPSRHLGLVPAGEGGEARERVERIIDHIEQNLDLKALLSLTAAGGSTAANAADYRVPRESPLPGDTSSRRAEGVRLAVARDEAFSFYYRDSLEELEDAGASLVYFSPLRDRELPACDGIYLGGGFPEVFAAELEANSSMRASIADANARRLPIYAECGGMVYLCQSVEVKGCRRRMAGVIPAKARMNPTRQAMGYVDARALRGNIVLEAGQSIHGHEFHWSSIEWPGVGAAYECLATRGGGVSKQGYVEGNLLASFVHVNFRGYPEAARRFVAACEGGSGVSAVAGN